MSGRLSLDGPIVYGNITVGTTATELNVGASNLAGRRTLLVQPIDRDMFIGFDSSVTTSNGIQLFKGQVFALDILETESVYGIAVANTDVRITEAG
jgi:hypothetical protein